MSAPKCSICPHGCVLKEGQTGLCRARRNAGGTVTADNYGRITAMALDPIEKKPLYHFFPGSRILSIGSYGCNLGCPFCQNHDIAAATAGDVHTVFMPPEMLLEKAQSVQGNIGVAFTYNEPLISWEYVRDCATILKQHGLKTVLVTNGYVNEPPLLELLPLIDAMNIDLKCFTEEGYRRLGGRLAPVMRTIELAARHCHVEVTTLIVPQLSDSADDMRRESEWLAGLSPDIPLHVSRFFPRYRMSDARPTPVQTVYALAEVARGALKYVYTGNC